jgi:hypothetical protein
MSRPALISLALLLPVAGRADGREFYTLFGAQLVLPHYYDTLSATDTATPIAGALEFTAYYGLTNTIHVGIAAHVSRARDIALSKATVTLSDGSASPGAVYENDLAIGAGALVLYRFDTRRVLAPVLSLEIGANHHSYTQIDHIPAGATYQITFPDSSEFVLSGRAAFLLEYRLGDRFVATSGVSLVLEPGGHAPWQIALPFLVGVIW